MQREQAVEIARKSVLTYAQRSAYGYLPTNEVEAANWMPPGWVIEAITTATKGYVSGKPVTSETQAIEFSFFQAEHLFSLFGGNTDAKYTVTTSDEGKLIAHAQDKPSVELNID